MDIIAKIHKAKYLLLDNGLTPEFIYLNECDWAEMKECMHLVEDQTVKGRGETFDGMQVLCRSDIVSPGQVLLTVEPLRTREEMICRTA